MILYYPNVIRETLMKNFGGSKFWLDVFGRLHPDYVTEHYAAWREELREQAAQSKILFNVTLGPFVRPCVSCLCGDESAVMPTAAPGKYNASVAMEIDPFPNSRVLEQRLNIEADEEYKEDDGYVQQLTSRYFAASPDKVLAITDGGNGSKPLAIEDGNAEG